MCGNPQYQDLNEAWKPKEQMFELSCVYHGLIINYMTTKSPKVMPSHIVDNSFDATNFIAARVK